MQAWWNTSGIEVPANVGHHVHLGTCFPRDGAILDGTLHLDLRVLLHAQPAGARVVRLRAGSESVTLLDRTSDVGVPVDANGDGNRTFPVDLDIGRLSTGRHELRMSAFVAQPDGAQMFESSGLQFCVRACSPSYRSAGPGQIGRGWYTDHGYANATLKTHPWDIRSGGTVAVTLAPGSGGRATVFSGVYIDPDFHHGSAGLVVGQWAGPFSGTVRLPTLASGSHRLVLLSHDGQNAGVLAVTFVVP